MTVQVSISLRHELHWPQISIVTPSFNQGQYIEETINSILSQGYPNLEYIIIDGGSSDNTVEIIKKYERWLEHWVSEKDNGQAHAVNKGLKRARGEIFQFINSDDVLAPGALFKVAEAFGGVHVVAGSVREFGASSPDHVVANRRLNPQELLKRFYRSDHSSWHQPGVWMRRDRLQTLGGFDEQFRYAFDLELTVRYLERWPKIRYLDDVLVNFRLHPQSKTMSETETFGRESVRVREVLAERLQERKQRKIARRAAAAFSWPARVGEIMHAKERSAAAKIRTLLLESVFDPSARLTRVTAGALRRIAFGQV